MSRALDPVVIAALKAGDHAQIYKDISLALLAIDAPCEIEILWPGFPLGPDQNVLREDGALGVPQLRLVQAFFVARQIFFDQASGSRASTPDEIRAATAVILLMDSEHLTATNARKRLLLAELDRLAHTDTCSAEDLFRREMCYMDTLLTSPLHRHTKSPVLWSHRRWLVQEQSRRGIHQSAALVEDAICRVIMVAGEKHPRNYYAWTHARWLLGLVRQQPRRSGRGNSQPTSRVRDESGPELEGHDAARSADVDQDDDAVFEDLVVCVRSWCYRNYSDVSGWSFLLHIMGSCGGHDSELAHRMREEVSMVAERMRWRNESVRWFLDMAAQHHGAALGHVPGSTESHATSTSIDA